MEGAIDKEDLLSVQQLNVEFRTPKKDYVRAVKDIHFSIKKGETLAIVGESGSGKSVTSLSIMRLLSKNNSRIRGNVLFQGKNVLDLSEKEMRAIRGRYISMIFQEPMTSLNPIHKIGRQIGEVIALHEQLPKEEIRKKTVEMLKKVGIPRAEIIVDEYPHQLSGGMRQRVMIAMAMACNPSLLIADEPTTALDVTIQAQILDLMNDLKKNSQTAILLITHDLGVVAEMSDRVMVMYYGQIVEEADVKTLFRDPKHPYTIGLIQSIPSLTGEQSRLQPIEGNVPNLGEVKTGCAFYSRCQHAHRICQTEEPPLIHKSENHFVRCWLYKEDGDHLDG